jgi:hypothetical protein
VGRNQEEKKWVSFGQQRVEAGSIVRKITEGGIEWQKK